MKINIVPVWKQVTPELADELVAFWLENKALGDEASARQRTEQAICIARDENGKLQGVSTGVIRVLPRLRQPMYYYRQYFSREMRGRSQLLPFYLQSKQVLQDYNAALKPAESIGILLELGNGKLAAAYAHAYEKAFDVTFIGYSPSGLELRVSYFENAVLLPPVPVRPAAAASQRAPTTVWARSVACITAATTATRPGATAASA